MSNVLTVGMATYEDFDGVYFTLSALREYHPRVEIVVLDNATTACKRTQAITVASGGRYLHRPDLVGTSRSRDHLFHLASTPWLCVCDSHVLFGQGAIRALLDYLAGQPDSVDLISGPLLCDDSSTVLAFWRQHRPPLLDGQWAMDGREIDRFGLPFEIPMQGLGVFCQRVAAWPGFNPHFRGFGGEEGYLHELVRRKGGKALCLPSLRWRHRFRDIVKPAVPPPYPFSLEDHTFNLLVGHRELGIDALPQIREHFGNRLPPHVFDALCAEAQAKQPWGEIHAAPVVPGASAWYDRASPAEGTVMNGNCQPCADKASAAAAAASAARTPTMLPSNGVGNPPATFGVDLDSWYETARHIYADIHEHMPTLRDLATGCAAVGELSNTINGALVSLLASRSPRVVSVCPGPKPEWFELVKLIPPHVVFQGIPSDTREADLPDLDFLFIDSKHTADHVYAELTRHAPKVRRRIALHDTVIFGEMGEDGGPGLLPGLRRFLNEHREWTVWKHYPNNYGLTVLSRDPADKKTLPGKMTQAINYAQALARHALSGGTATAEQVGKRLEICSLCDQRNGERCGVCGCPIEAKSSWGEQECPLGKWTAEGV